MNEEQKNEELRMKNEEFLNGECVLQEDVRGVGGFSM